MAGPSAVTPTETNPKHDITLSDGTDTVGLVLVGADGQPRPQFERTGMPNDALLASQGQSEYSNYEPGYMRVEQNDWTGGRGLDDFDKDRTRYFDGKGINPTSQALMPGPLLNYSDNLVTEYKFMPDDNLQNTGVSSLYSTSRYRSVTINPPTVTMAYIETIVRKVGTPTAAFTIAIYTNNGATNQPNALLDSATLAVASVTDTTWLHHRFALTESLSSGTTYHVVVYGGASDDATNHWDILNTEGGQTFDDTFISSDGASWNASAIGFFYRLYPTYWESSIIPFEYKGAQYFVVQHDAHNSYLFMSGDRGAADDNSLALTTLVDATKTWTVNEWAGCIVKITAGPGAEENIPYRTISSNTDTTLTVSPAWNITHTTVTEYVITKSNKLKQCSVAGAGNGDMGGHVTDVAVSGANVYFARGDTGSLNIFRYVEYNNSGTWAYNTAVENVKARSILAIRHPDDDRVVLYGTLHNHPLYGSCVWKGLVPREWGNLYTDKGVLFPTEPPWLEDSPASGVTLNLNGASMEVVIAAGAALGTLCSTKLATAVNITSGNYLAFEGSCTVDLASGDFEIETDHEATFATPIEYDIPAMTANELTWVTIPIVDPTDTAPSAVEEELTAVLSGRLSMVTDKTCTFNMWNGVRVITDALTYIDMPNHARLNKLVAYGGNADDPRRNPWVIAEDQIYEIQTQDGDAVVPIPLDEIGALKGSENGNAAGANDIYLYFNLGRKFERYALRNLDDVGPDLDSGLPENRQGDLVGFVSYPGRAFIGIDGGTSNYSSILEIRGSAWHEVYRAPETGRRIRGLGVQSIPGSSMGRLWFRLDDTICWIPMSLNPLSDGEYTFTYEGLLESPWMYAGTKGVKKAWKSIVVFANEVDASNTITVDYKIDDDTDAWIPVSTPITSGPFYELDLATTPPTGYRFKYRLHLNQKDLANETGAIDAIKVRAVVVNAYGVAPIKHGYSFVTKVAEDFEQVNLENEKELALGYSSRVETAIALLDGWAAALTPLTMCSRFSPIDSKTVLLKDPRILLYKIDSYDQVEEHMLQLTVHEL